MHKIKEDLKELLLGSKKHNPTLLAPNDRLFFTFQ
jgi:hypothetical protein